MATSIKTVVESVKQSVKGNVPSVLVALLAVGIVLFSPDLTFASTSNGTEFASLFNRLVGYVNGIPGIMAAIGLLAVGIYMSFVGGKNPMYFFFTALGAAAIFLIPSIATGMGGAIF